MITSIAKATIFSCLIFLSWTGTAQVNSSIYLDYNGSCMNRFEYQYESGGDVSTGYEKYQAFTSPYVKLLLDVGMEKGEWSDIKPEGTRKCGTVNFNKELARSVNAKEDQLFIVKPDEGGYRIVPVQNIEIFEYVGDVIKFQDGDVSFDFQVGGLFEMKVKEASDNTTYFKSEHELPCQKEIVFREFISKTESTYSEVHLMAHLGLIYREQVAGGGNKEQIRADYTIIKGNGHTINHFIADGCEGLKLIDPILGQENGGDDMMQVASFGNQPELNNIAPKPTTPINTGVASIPETSSPSIPQPNVNEGEALYFLPTANEKGNYEDLGDELAARGVEETSTVNETNDNYHTVEEGENLYRISLKYKTTVKKLQELNQMGNSTNIKVGNPLKIK